MLFASMKVHDSPKRPCTHGGSRKLVVGKASPEGLRRQEHKWRVSFDRPLTPRRRGGHWRSKDSATSGTPSFKCESLPRVSVALNLPANLVGND
jgi:hypothetical protein